MTREEAEQRCTELAAESPERDTHRWIPREEPDGSWSVVKIALPPVGDLTAETRAAERPDTPPDPRPDVPPHAAGF